ncbi:MAG: aspartate aminotransferase family protein [Gammaproteobacteria bacterium]|nr:aspartate aminotransferase family protein [Gammaproteobacteria bacterium]
MSKSAKKNITDGQLVIEQSRDALWPNYSPPQDLLFSHGVGSELVTENGEVYLDFLSGIAVTAFGHSHPHLVKALQSQTEKLWHLSNIFRIPASERFAGQLVQHSFADRVYFANSGTEAIEAGIKAVRAYQAGIGHKERFRLLGFTDSFHGRTIAAVAASGNPGYMQNFAPTDHGFDQVPWGDLKAVKAAISPQTAGILIETVQGEGGIRPVNRDFLAGLRALCDSHGLLLMLDEVQCGAGRTGKLFAHENFEIQPDVLAAAKGLGGGFPLGACLATESVGKHMVVGTHGSTFGGNPLAMAVGNAVLDLLLEPGLLDEVSRKGAELRTALENLVTAHPSVLERVTGMGLMIGVKCVVPNVDLMAALRTNRLLVGRAGDNMIRLLPPLNVSDAHLEQALNTITDTIEKLA